MSAPTTICEFKDGWYKTYEITPEQFGLKRCTREDLAGGTPEENAQITRDILSGAERGPKRSTVLMNAGAAIYIGGAAGSLEDGVKKAAELIDSGKAQAVMEAYIRTSQETC